MNVTLRRAEPADSTRVWEWNNAPEVRAASISRDPIPREDHERWFAAKLASADSLVLVIEGDGVPCGVVRFDRRGEHGVVSIALEASARGKGIGRRAIEEGGRRYRELVPVRSLEAWVDASNPASLRAFEAAGFARESETDVGGRRFVIFRR